MKKKTQISIFSTILFFILFVAFPSVSNAQTYNSNNDSTDTWRDSTTVDSMETDSTDMNSDTTSYQPMGFLNLE